MKTIINNENQKVEVPEGLFNILFSEFKNGIWAVLIKVKDQPHVILMDQFAIYE